MELQQLKYFKAVADIEKISQAAESLFVSAPALSTSISRLETELGVPLFDRANNRIRLIRNTQAVQIPGFVPPVLASPKRRCLHSFCGHRCLLYMFFLPDCGVQLHYQPGCQEAHYRTTEIQDNITGGAGSVRKPLNVLIRNRHCQDIEQSRSIAFFLKIYRDFFCQQHYCHTQGRILNQVRRLSYQPSSILALGIFLGQNRIRHRIAGIPGLLQPFQGIGDDKRSNQQDNGRLQSPPLIGILQNLYITLFSQIYHYLSNTNRQQEH